MDTSIERDPRKRFRIGLALLAFLLVFGAVIVPYPMMRVAVDLIGDEAQGRVTGRRDGYIWNRYRANIPVSTVDYVFTTGNGRQITADEGMREGHAPRVGQRVVVAYVAVWPEISFIGEPPYDDVAFLLWLGLALAMVWLFLTVLYRMAVPPEFPD